MGYVTAEGAAALKAYKYEGEDKSYIYKHILTPMNNFLVQFIPLWMAPNLITLCGLMFNVSAHVLTYMYSPNMDQVLPPWLYAWSGFCFFAYQTIDNLDGKQARRTESSSPLGLLFDHGIDAFNTTLGTITQATVMQMGLSHCMYYLWLVGIGCFVFATWEEYYTGKLTLGVVNGPTDGLLLCVLFCFFGAYKPGMWSLTFAEALPSLFAGHWLAGYRLHYLPLFFVMVGGVLTCLNHAWTVFTNSKNHGVQHPLKVLVPFFVHMGAGYIWSVYSPSNIYQRSPRMFVWCIGILFNQCICQLMLSHLCKYKYAAMRPAVIPWVVATALSLLPIYTGKPSPLPEDTLLLIAFGFHIIFLGHFMFGVIWEITTVLEIRAFVITPKSTAPTATGSTSKPATTASTTAAPNSTKKKNK